MPKVEELKQLLLIDKLALDDEVSRQPTLFLEVSEAYIGAAAERDACKEELASIDAELDGIVRRRLEKTSEGKVTEPMVKNAIQADKAHGAAFDTYMKAKTDADVLLALKEAFAQRAYMLREMSGLYVAGYFERTSMGGGLDKAHYSKRREQLAEARTRNG